MNYELRIMNDLCIRENLYLRLILGMLKVRKIGLLPKPKSSFCHNKSVV